jgi:acylphosphatase
MTDVPTTKRVHVFISGRVQGVWFRRSTREMADLLGLVGWVRNTPDGRVEAVFEGPVAQVDEMLKWCHVGPRSARVSEVRTMPVDTTESFSTFSIRR